MFGKGNPEVLASMKDLSAVEFAVLSSIAVLVLVFGVYPQCVLDMVDSSVQFIFKALNA